MTDFETYKEQLKTEIDGLPEGSKVFLSAISPIEVDENAAEVMTTLHGSLADLIELISHGVKEALIECGLKPTAGAKFVATLSRRIAQASAEAGRKVLEGMSKDERDAELKVMLDEMLQNLTDSDDSEEESN